MADPVVRQKLQRDILPYLISARRLRGQWFYWLHIVFGYATDLVVALTTLGISTPLISFFGESGTSEAAGQKATALPAMLATVPAWLYYPMLLLLLFWVVLRVVFAREEGQKRAVLAKSCTQALREVEVKLHRALAQPSPLSDLNELLDKHITPTVDRNFQEKAWPWAPFAPNIEKEVEQELAGLCGKYEADWKPGESTDLRKPRDKTRR